MSHEVSLLCFFIEMLFEALKEYQFKTYHAVESDLELRQSTSYHKFFFEGQKMKLLLMKTIFDNANDICFDSCSLLKKHLLHDHSYDIARWIRCFPLNWKYYHWMVLNLVPHIYFEGYNGTEHQNQSDDADLWSACVYISLPLVNHIQWIV